MLLAAKAKAIKQPAPPAPPTPVENLPLDAEGITELLANSVSEVKVSGNAVESLIANKNIGLRIRALRLKQSMGLVELGRHSGLSSSFLSQLETGRVVPTLRNLARIAMVFSKDISYFFSTVRQGGFKVQVQQV